MLFLKGRVGRNGWSYSSDVNAIKDKEHHRGALDQTTLKRRQLNAISDPQTGSCAGGGKIV